MTIIQKLRAHLAIRRVAKQQGISTAQCRAYIEEAIRAAWATTDPRAKELQNWLVGEGRVPTPEELIYIIACEV